MRSLIYVDVYLNYVKLIINEILDKIKKKRHVFRLDKNIIRIL